VNVKRTCVFVTFVGCRFEVGAPSVTARGTTTEPSRIAGDGVNPRLCDSQQGDLALFDPHGRCVVPRCIDQFGSVEEFRYYSELLHVVQTVSYDSYSAGGNVEAHWWIDRRGSPVGEFELRRALQIESPGPYASGQVPLTMHIASRMPYAVTCGDTFGEVSMSVLQYGFDSAPWMVKVRSWYQTHPLVVHQVVACIGGRMLASQLPPPSGDSSELYMEDALFMKQWGSGEVEGREWRLFDMEGRVVKRYEGVISVRLPDEILLQDKGYGEDVIQIDPYDYYLRDGIRVDFEQGSGLIDPMTWTLLRDDTQCCAGEGLLAERESNGMPWRYRAMDGSRLVPKQPFVEVTKFSAGLAAARLEGDTTWSVIDRWGQVRSNGHAFGRVLGVSYGTLVVAVDGGKQGVFDLQLGDWVHPPMYTSINPYFVGHYYAAARLETSPEVIYLGRAGEVAVLMDCSELLPRCEGVAAPLCDLRPSAKQ
jgi:hypothetical protein